MAIFSYITGISGQVKIVKSDIDRYIDESNLDLTKVIEDVKKEVYRDLKAKATTEYPSYDNADLDTLLVDVKDLPEEKNILCRIANLVVSKILEHNELYDQASYYRSLALQIPLTYYIDTDASGAAGREEIQRHPSVVFGR